MKWYKSYFIRLVSLKLPFWSPCFWIDKPFHIVLLHRRPLLKIWTRFGQLPNNIIWEHCHFVLSYSMSMLSCVREYCIWNPWSMLFIYSKYLQGTKRYRSTEIKVVVDFLPLGKRGTCLNNCIWRSRPQFVRLVWIKINITIVIRY